MPDDVAAWFLPAEENPGQLRDSRERRAAAVEWAMLAYGQLPAWLELAGVSLEDAPAAGA
jgi:hypothetical protein